MTILVILIDGAFRQCTEEQDTLCLSFPEGNNVSEIFYYHGSQTGCPSVLIPDGREGPP